jgi:hypothetical protein
MPPLSTALAHPLTPTGWGVAAGAVFAALWGLVGARGLAGAWRRRIAVLVLMASAGLVARALIAPPQPAYAQRFDAHIYGYAVAFEIVGVVLAALALRAPGRRGLLAPVLAIITGLHFVGLWLATGQRLFVGVTLGLCAAGLIALGWARRPNSAADPRLAIAGLGSAFVLWAACLSSLA